MSTSLFQPPGDCNIWSAEASDLRGRKGRHNQEDNLHTPTSTSLWELPETKWDIYKMGQRGSYLERRGIKMLNMHVLTFFVCTFLFFLQRFLFPLEKQRLWILKTAVNISTCVLKMVFERKGNSKKQNAIKIALKYKRWKWCFCSNLCYQSVDPIL